MTSLGQKWAYLSTNHVQNAKRRAGSCGKNEFMSYVHCVWMPLKIQFRDSVECRLRKSRVVTSSTDSWITSKCFMYGVDVIYQSNGSSSSRLFSTSFFVGPMCRILRKIPQNRPGTWRLSVRKSFFKTLNGPIALWTEF